ncbi:hypothetical protein MAR_021772 [Mya arenaria]|uniref:Uncharacterized protein n=1 Tax=Mya arenaria TaxID=6604 RepID=A0ABY7E8U9_MYAAR|nr:hypothetical protein MAR_021772 [Mya arenaria]
MSGCTLWHIRCLTKVKCPCQIRKSQFIHGYAQFVFEFGYDCILSELPDIVENSMYVPAGHISRKVNNSDADALYAQPNKCKASGSKGAELYAEVNKVAKKKAAGKKRKKTTYENKAYESSTYENHELQETKKQVNKDGLIYADLAFPKQPKGRKPFIHGLDDMTVYADVDLSRKAEPLPDSDDEGSGEKNKK